MNESFAVPDEVREVCAELAKAGFEAYLVGGCVRDMILKHEPKDWDVATNAKPEEIQKLFKDSVYENDFGTVLVKTEKEENLENLDSRFRGNDKEGGDRKSRGKIKAVEVTTYRIEGKYSDKRHPDEVKFAKTIEEDLSRRDFTVNAMAMNLKGNIVDPFGGQDDLKKGIIRTVGDAEERFGEDALRLMRAVRFAVELDFEIDLATRRAIEKMAGGLEEIAKERVRDELQKMLMARNAAKGIILLEELDLLRYVLPELREGLGIGQNKHHIYSVFEHDVKSLDYTAKQGYSLPVRMAALLHDVGKPRAKVGDGPDSTFYQHEYISAKMAVRALDRLRFPKDLVEQVAHLVRRHMFHYNVGEISPAGVRRFVVRVGPENIDDLLKVREADRIGSGVAKAVPYKLRHLLFMIDKVKRDPLSPKMLKISGDDVMQELGLAAGPRIGWILAALLEEVLDDPKKNSRDALMEQMKKLNKLTDEKLKLLAESSRNKKDELEGEAETEIKKKHHVT
jgi:poly(A) polymerase/tRNA nucleotidyltransferase (CCA-adding enzyme)